MKRRLLFIVIPLILLMVIVPSVFADSTYVVQPGDTLFRIALDHDLTVQELSQANDIVNPSWIYAGQVLIIPSEEQPEEASTEVILHLVEPGETLFKIAVKYDASMQAIARLNDISNYDLVFSGQYLAIPQTSNAAPLESELLSSIEEDIPQSEFEDESESELLESDPPDSSDSVQSASDPLPSSDDVGSSERWIDVNLTTQTLTAYEGDQAVLTTSISSGAWPYLTVTGQFHIYLRYQAQDMDGYRLGYDYYLEDVPYVMYFYKDFAVHGTYWHNNFGYPMSHGCVNMTIADAQWVYNWSSYGTLVNVHY